MDLSGQDPLAGGQIYKSRNFIYGFEGDGKKITL